MRVRSAGAAAPTFAAAVFAVLLLATLGAFAATRELRSRDDLVNTVIVSPRVTPQGEPAQISFRLAEGDEEVAVEIIGREAERIRRLPGGGALEPGRHVFRWDGREDDGTYPARGRYGIRVILGEADRTIEPPGSIRLRGGRRLEGADGT
jgi:flagellar hook assembly protein FlgD